MGLEKNNIVVDSRLLNDLEASVQDLIKYINRALLYEDAYLVKSALYNVGKETVLMQAIIHSALGDSARTFPKEGNINE